MIKKILISAVLATYMTVSVGCYGSFTLTKKIYDWNGSLGSKWAQTGIMWAFMIIPVYEVCTFIDAVVLNMIEFWTSSNPLAINANK